MKLKRLAPGVWKVLARMEGEPGDRRDVPISVKFLVEPGLGLVYEEGTIRGQPAGEEEAWVLESWLESKEGEILDLIG